MPSPTSLTLRTLRRHGFLATVAESWIPHANRRRDLFGCIDVLAIDRREPGILAVQCTTLPHIPDRLAKARGRPELAAWLRAGGRFEVWGWSKRAGRWQVRIIAVRPEDLATAPIRDRRPRRGRRPRQRELFD